MNKDNIYDKLNENYNYLDSIMGAIYDETLPLEKESLLQALGELGCKLLQTQKEIVHDDLLLVSKVEEKENVLLNALNDITNKKSK